VYLKVAGRRSSAISFKQCATLSDVAPGAQVTVSVVDAQDVVQDSISTTLCSEAEFNIYSWGEMSLFSVSGSGGCQYSSGAASRVIMLNRLDGADGNQVTFDVTSHVGGQSMSGQTVTGAQPCNLNSFLQFDYPAGTTGSVRCDYMHQGHSYSASGTFDSTATNSIQVVGLTGNMMHDPSSASLSRVVEVLRPTPTTTPGPDDALALNTLGLALVGIGAVLIAGIGLSMWVTQRRKKQQMERNGRKPVLPMANPGVPVVLSPMARD